MDKIIRRSEQYDLTGSDVHRITDGKANIIQYEQLEKVNSVDEILGEYGACIILYTTRLNFGHWVGLIRRSEKILEFFDPYGLKIDAELNITNELHLRQHEGRIVPHLTVLISKSQYVVKSNTHQLQKFLDHTETCGRWVALRIRLRAKTLAEFTRLMTRNRCYDGDFWVSALTIFV